MNLERLKAFYRVSEFKSFTKAAEIYNVTPGALSKSVKALEYELQVHLFIRNNNSLELTEEGAELHRVASEILKKTQLAEESLNNSVHLNKGKINIHATQGFSSMYLSKYIHEFMNENPEVELSIKSVADKTKSEFLASGIAIHPYIDGLKGYDQIFLTNFTFKLYASKAYLEKYGVPESLQDLDKHKLIAYSRDKSYEYFDMNWHLKRGCPKGKVRNYCIEIDGTFGRCKLAANGVGIISVPQEHPEIHAYNLVEVLPDIAVPAFEYYIIVDKVLRKYARIESLINFMLSKHHIR